VAAVDSNKFNQARRLAAAGISDTIIDQLLGHQDHRAILRFYTARVPEYLRDAIARLVELRAAKTTVHGGTKIGLNGDEVPKGPVLVN
jgi:hypothetical protein